MRYVNVVAEFCAMQDTIGAAALRWVVIVVLLFLVVLADNCLHSSAPAAAFGYLLGGITIYGTIRKMLKQTEAGRRALEERGG